ncbi:MAG TPA: protein kinase [Gemmatimonadales bacterium]|nr:protein kinase [Gemmatimonadales bacterium]
MTDSSSVERLSASLAGRYTIEREVGAGGMATVYLAQDLKHHRKVALKVLRAELAATLGAERFSREIEVAAQLQHPHILPLLDSGEAGGFYYYVMPYVEGESLRERLAHRGELPVHDAVKILIEVTDALAHAHAHGVVHRDIKPDNVMLSGRHALVTDFGVAKAVSEATGAHTLTSIGIALGTPAYMAPEQAAADPHLDHRVDLYAVGVLGYELLTGRPPFAGLTPQETLAAHVTQAPEPVQNRRPGISPALAAVLMKCLAKRPADRWQTAEELLVQLEPLATPSAGMTPTQSRPAVVTRRIPTWVPWAAGAAVILAVVLFVFVLPERQGPTIVLGRRVAVASSPDLESWPSLSSDGKLVTYTRQHGTVYEQVVQQIDGGAPVAVTERLPGSHGFGALSPDGERILMLAADGLQSIPTLGGQVRQVAAGVAAIASPATLGGGGGGQSGGILWGSWSPDGNRVAFTLSDTLFLQPLGSGRTVLATGLQLHSPAWSPDGSWIAYVEGNPGFHGGGNLAPSAVRVVRASGGRPILVAGGGSLNTSPIWIPGGGRPALLFISDREGGRDIYQAALGRSGRPSGSPVRVSTGLNPERLSISADGKRLAWSVYTESSNVWSLRIPERDSISISEARPVTSGAQIIEVATVSPDGRWLYYDSDRSGNSDIWRQSLSGGIPEQLTTDTAAEFNPMVSPDNQEVAFHSFRTGNRDIFVMRAAGGNEVQVTTSPQEDWNPTWAPDGQSLVWDQQLHLDSVLWTSRRRPDGSWEPAHLLTTGIRSASISRYSPDGRWIAFNSTTGLKLLEVSTGQVHDVTRTGGWAAWGEGSNVLYFATGVDSAGRFTIKSVSPSGGVPRTVAYGNDPVSQGRRYGLAVSRGRFYFPLVERKADIWVAEVRLQ